MKHLSSVYSVIETYDNLLNEGNFAGCDFLLRVKGPDRYDDACIVAVLGITLAAKGKLKSRQDFYDHALIVVAGRRGVEGAKQLLSKYQ